MGTGREFVEEFDTVPVQRLLGGNIVGRGR
jgi:hypothetical protein